MPEGELDIFSIEQRYPISPDVFTAADPLIHLGFSVDSENELSRRDQFLLDYNKQVRIVENTEALFGGEKVDESRPNRLQIPNITFLTKDDERSVAVHFDKNTIVILKEKPITIYMGIGVKYEGFPIQHILIKGNNGGYLDLKSVTQLDTDQLFSFSGRGSGYSVTRTYELGGKNVKYPSDVFIAMPTNEQEDGTLKWNIDKLIQIYLHENSHDICSIYHKTIKQDPSLWKQKERDVNAVSLYIARTINRMHPEARFIDVNKLKTNIEEQLAMGYDKDQTSIQKQCYKLLQINQGKN